MFLQGLKEAFGKPDDRKQKPGLGKRKHGKNQKPGNGEKKRKGLRPAKLEERARSFDEKHAGILAKQKDFNPSNNKAKQQSKFDKGPSSS